jgi:hypothetical protein
MVPIKLHLGLNCKSIAHAMSLLCIYTKGELGQPVFSTFFSSARFPAAVGQVLGANSEGQVPKAERSSKSENHTPPCAKALDSWISQHRSVSTHPEPQPARQAGYPAATHPRLQRECSMCEFSFGPRFSTFGMGAL